ncbi:MAG TPA: hypothetical protein IAC04_07435 [Candidatus Coprenecus stercoravium]|uniref:Uncharacterized protein n=1 Tax=Candidatus Coprenecus stercoravium TaxID=2840735 RepID=A0A9D2GQG2_9BACT|nr:hypothetical protein [Candidatus Coprenecus stercoravium]
MRDILLHENTLVCSDDDLECHWASISVGFDKDMNFVFMMKETFDSFDYYEVLHNIESKRKRYEETYTSAVLDRDNTDILCQDLNTSLLNLSDAVWEEFNDQHPSYVPSAIRSIFKEITEYLIDIGCKFVIKVETEKHD